MTIFILTLMFAVTVTGFEFVVINRFSKKNLLPTFLTSCIVALLFQITLFLYAIAESLYLSV